MRYCAHTFAFMSLSEFYYDSLTLRLNDLTIFFFSNVTPESLQLQMCKVFMQGLKFSSLHNEQNCLEDYPH